MLADSAGRFNWLIVLGKVRKVLWHFFIHTSLWEDELMTKADLVAKVALKANMTKAAAERALNAFLDSVKDTLVKEGKLTLTGFGAFSVATRKARPGRNPRTGAKITIPASKMVKFRAGKLLKDVVKQ